MLMKRIITMVSVMIVIILTNACTSRTEIESARKANTPVLVLNDSVTAINYKHVKVGGDKEITVLTINFTLNGEERTAITSEYGTAYALNDSLKHDLAIGYFIKKKHIR